MSDIASPASLRDEDEAPINTPPESPAANDDDDDGLDDESDLSEVDEAQFDNFEPTIVDRPQPVDAENIRAIGVHKRKRPTTGTEGADEKEERRKEKRKKDSRARKPKRSRKTREELDQDEKFSGGEQIEGKRARRGRGEGERRPRAPVEDDEPDENLTPDERRRKALENKITNALRNPNQRRGRPAGIVSYFLTCYIVANSSGP
jgi:transcription factor SPN1